MRTFAFAVALTLLSTAHGVAGDFRVVTTISEGDEKRSESTTVFYRNRVFDTSHPEKLEFTIYDPTVRQIRLIDLRRKVQTIVPTDALTNYTAQLKLAGQALKDGKFFVNPKFEDRSEGSKIHLYSKEIVYEAQTTEPRDEKAAADYRRFADWICQLNATDNKNPPPFARMELNKALGKNKTLPAKVSLSIPYRSRTRKLVSQHVYHWNLSRADREMCETVGGYITDPKIRVIEFNEYRKGSR